MNLSNALKTEPKLNVVVAMSGGVDSSVAALLLAAEGHSVVGVSMQVWDYSKSGGCSSRATCCAPDDFTDARMVAAAINVPYYVMDLEAEFREKVIDPFIDFYVGGKTPNPCVDCNGKVKFRELRGRSNSFGCEYVATGHYAQIKEINGELALLRGVDKDKDQSYFLYEITKEELAKTLFPIGHLQKSEVRYLAAEAGLLTAQKKESQDICFISGRVDEFITRVRPKFSANSLSGEVVNLQGEVLGKHSGIHSFTIGQRRGIGLGGGSDPLYVVAIEPETRRIVLGKRSDLERETFVVEQCNWLVDPHALTSRSSESPAEVTVQVRHRHSGSKAELSFYEGGSNFIHSVEVRLKDNLVAVAPGQAAVFYDSKNERVLGGGRISLKLRGLGE
jgi:tRNA-uridine 2-sulfurtransferase